MSKTEFTVGDTAGSEDKHGGRATSEKKENPSMFYRKSENGYRRVLDGLDLKTLVHGERTLLAEFHLATGAVLPVHHHPHEQTGYLVSGRLRLTVGEETFEAGPGDAWTVPSEVPHGGQALADTVAVEVFSPVREDYLDP
jgi:quercetin dioxygenase-like cupin family protein